MLVFTFALSLFGNANAQKTSLSEAQNEALQFLKQKNATTQLTPTANTARTRAVSNQPYYVFNAPNNQGFVIISGDRRMPTVLGYSTNGHCPETDMPDNLRAWMQSYVANYRALASTPSTRSVVSTPTLIKKKNPIGPLLKIQWDQGEPYNRDCPTIGGAHAVTGCAATALAQIMAYHRWPNELKNDIADPSQRTIPSHVTTEITSIAPSSDSQAAIYNFRGHKLGMVHIINGTPQLHALPHGVYIVNGKKFIK
ncbi:Spi family protease inhibitor [Prevotella sp. DNF00663]|uniref:Spi family protease inhibitor n=1 Tax=Prevotella sp. DNF00663 TaxID=1384078 RepID=UPI001E356EC1|nr:Spi family protease inhibitor [Prevotella sp. DNF00663]